MSMSESNVCSTTCKEVPVANWEEGWGRGTREEEKGRGEFSSSEESAGVTVCVRSGAGLVRGAREMARTCFVLGEVLKGKLHCFSCFCIAREQDRV